MLRKRFRLELKKETLYLGDRTLIFSVLKLPRIEEEHGRFQEIDSLAARARQELEHGADVIDVSAMSLSPARFPVSEEVEMRSVLPMVRRLHKDGTPWICVTTTHASVAAKALQAGADFVNDPSGLKLDADMGAAVCQNDGALLIAHMRETPRTWANLAPLRDPIGEAFIVLRANLSRAVRAGIPTSRILVDPGLGLGKRKEENTQILAQIERLQELEYPMLLTLNGKTLVGDAVPEGRAAAEAAAMAFAVESGIHGFRTNSAAETRSLANVIDALQLARADWHERNARRAAAPRKQTSGSVEAAIQEKRGINRRGKLPPLRPRPSRH
jgi:dihydropteroate synthase